jgi:hypothetical protein
MSTCSNCYNGCAETISDQCVKYTGINVPALGISNGDNLLTVENAIINFLVPAINGTGIKPIIDPNIICDLVKSYLPACTTCTGFTLNEILTAIVKTVCDLQTQIDVVDATLDILNAPYKVGCLSGVTTSSETHDVLQATIDNLCSLNSAFSILVAQLADTNVTSLNVNTYIAAYLAGSPLTTLASSRMVPYAPIPYFGPLSNYPSAGDSFSLSGVGSGYWAKVYLCNGANPGVPDLRGWTLVGVTTGMGGGTLNSIVDPAVNPDNPVYTITGPDSLNGSTTVTLGIGEIPNHTHPNIINTTFNDPEHRHKFSDDTTNPTNALRASNDIIPQGTAPYTEATISGEGTGTGQIYLTSKESTGITLDVVLTNAGMGSGGAHSNVQPSKGCYYIIYIP